MTDDSKVDYLSATLELTASVVPEMKKLILVPHFDEGLIEFCIEEAPEDVGEAVVSINVRQVECLVDFLTAWLARRKRAA